MSGRASRDKGARWERAVVHYLHDRGFTHTERRAPGQPIDRGDVLGITGVVIECKDHATPTPGAWLDQALEAATRSRADLAVVIAKRRGKPDPADSFSILRTDQLVDLLLELYTEGNTR